MIALVHSEAIVAGLSTALGVFLVFVAGFLARGRWDFAQAKRRARKRLYAAMLAESFRDDPVIEAWNAARFYDQDREDR